MVKQKTNRSAAKRFVITKRGKILRRYTQQDHFNIGRPKKTIRKRRRDLTVSPSDQSRFTRLLPFGL